MVDYPLLPSKAVPVTCRKISSRDGSIIIEEADRLGLAQLYQLRGRVGRSDRQAFAYVTYRRDKILTEVAEKRLAAIRDFTELGAGFKIALRDRSFIS